MTRSKIFYTDRYKQVEKNIVDLINSQKNFLTDRTIGSPRATGDAIQAILSEKFKSLLGDLCHEYSPSFARRAMADLAFTDKDNFYYVVDVKTHRMEPGFHMPNITSVERLTRFYEDDNNYFVVLVIKYTVKGNGIKVKRVHFVPIEFLSWNCLTIGALGWGQIQIANANVIDVNPGYSRKKWMIELCNVMLKFYPKEIGKVKERIDYFKQVKRHWQKKLER